MSAYPATKLDEVYRACNPEEALAPGDERYVDLNPVRGGEDLARRIGWEITAGGEAECLHKLVTGHRGSGKTTELLRLKAALEQDGVFVVYVDIEDMLDLGDINYLDVLLAIARALGESLGEANIEVEPGLLANIEKWFSESILTESRETTGNAAASAGFEAGGGVPFLGKLFGKATAEIKAASSSRKEIRRKLDRDLSKFLLYLRGFVTSAQLSAKRKQKSNLVFIVDGLEKTVYRENKDGGSNLYELFIHHADQLKAPGCHIIYTVPISLAFKAQLGDAWPAGAYVIPMVKHATDEGKAKLLEAVARRAEVDAVFETRETVEDFIALSGGAMRDLLRLIRMACGPQERIGREDGVRAIRAFLREYDRLIREEDRERLAEVAEKHRVPNAAEYEWLLHHRLIHEYQNGERWACAHPAVQLLLDLPDKPTLKTV